MTDARFNLGFNGGLVPGADPQQVQQRLAEIFKLDAQGVARLFSGKTILVRRDADAATAAKMKRLFEDAGALLLIEPVPATASPPARPEQTTASNRDAGGAGNAAAPSGAAPVETPVENQARPPQTTASTLGSGLSLAPMDSFLEEPPSVKIRPLDVSHLSLVPGPEWSLADCEPAASAVFIPDISHLSLVALERPTEETTSDF